VRKLIKGILIVVGAVLALCAVGVLAINLYVQSAGTQKRIEHALSSGLKVPVHVTSIIVTPWSGLKASGITVEQTMPAAVGDFLEATDFSARFGWMGLFKHRLDASDVVLDEPRVTWYQTNGGRWELPRATPAPEAEASPEAPGVEKAKGPKGPAWEVSVHRLAVNRASFDFWDDKGMHLLQFAGVYFDCMEPREAGTDWSFERGTLKLAGFQTGVGGGMIKGDAQVFTQAKHSPFNVDVSFDGVDVNQLMVEAGQPDGQVTGKLKGWLDLNGNSGKRTTLNGAGHLELAGGRMENMEMFQMMGQALQIPDLVELNLRTAEADARVVSGVVNIDKLVLESQNLQLTAHGTIGTDGKLNLSTRLTINDVISDRLPAFIITYFKPGDAADSHYVDFTINNTLAHPKTNLIDNLLGHRIQGQMNDVFKMLFGKKKPKAEPTPVQQP
jgi:type II secretion system protein N